MFEFAKLWLALKTDRRAVTALEYGLIAAAVVAGIAVSVGDVGTAISAKFTSIASSI